MNDIYQEFIDRAVALHKQGRLNEAETIYHRILNRAPFDEGMQFLLADLYLRKECNGLAINLLSNLLQKNPDHAQAWCNLGIGYRKENRYSEARSAWLKSIDVGSETVEVCSNLAGLYADMAEPTKAFEWCNKALTLDSENVEAHWQRGLALLTQQRWVEGWADYEYRQRLETWDSRKRLECPIWNFTPVGHLYIHGEQGIGDEVMFCSVIPDIVGMAEKITLEVNPKVAALVKQTWPQFTVVTQETPGDYDAKIPIGSLACRYRPSDASFPRAPYFDPPQSKVEWYRYKLYQLGKPPFIALTWVGGMKATRVEQRSITLDLLKPITERFTCVSAQYSDTNPVIEQERAAFGLPKVNDESTGLDMLEQAALFKAVDAVVTVQQTAVHVAGSVGAPCYALIPSNPHWRYGIEGDRLPWYSSVRLFRNETNWPDVVGRILEALDADFGSVQRAKREAAR